MRKPPDIVRAFANASEALVNPKRVAAGRDEIDRVVEILALQLSIRSGSTHFVVKLVGVETAGASHAKNMLCEHV